MTVARRLPRRLQRSRPLVAMVSEHASPLCGPGGVDAGGQNVYVASLAAAIADRGVDVVVHTRRDDPSLPATVPLCPGVTVDHVDAGPPESLPKDDLWPFMDAFAAELASRWRMDLPAVVHAHFWMSGHASLAAGRRVGTPVLQTFHALGVVKRRHQGAADTSPPDRLGVEQRLVRHVDQVVATCSDEVNELLALGGDPRRITVVPCGVDVTRFNPFGPAERRRRAHRIVSVGRLVERKGVDTLVRALPQLPDVELVVAGGPPERDLRRDAEARRLCVLAHRLGVADRVDLRGQMPQEDLPALYRSATAVACTPWYEPFGIVPLEAMACGVPVIAAAVGGLTDTVADGVTGLHVGPRDHRHTAAAVRCLIDHPDLAHRLGRAGPRRVQDRFTWERVAEQVSELYARFCPVEAVAVGSSRP